MNISFNTRDPVYLQVIRHVKLLIARGELEGGDTIPSRRELATSLKINPNTVQRAYKEMEEAQLIHTERNKRVQLRRSKRYYRMFDENCYENQFISF